MKCSHWFVDIYLTQTMQATPPGSVSLTSDIATFFLFKGKEGRSVAYSRLAPCNSEMISGPLTNAVVLNSKAILCDTFALDQCRVQLGKAYIQCH